MSFTKVYQLSRMEVVQVAIFYCGIFKIQDSITTVYQIETNFSAHMFQIGEFNSKLG